ncbi:unnamed protein product [Adineta steineri]|uniref:Right handed beta helix domain-containing protein n=1 Tax=Adineta steineri TaxID=433720 RepID=A0A815TUZ4_9BILA|nr:unnamed protein product [Adineta steineri]CAF1508946.1 unnamed protein product [Adineta steineri]
MHLFTYCILLLYIINYTYGSYSIYVVPSLSISNNEETGTLENPFSTIEQARNYLRTIFRLSKYRIALYSTYHFLKNHTLSFDEHDHLITFTKMSDNERNQIQLERKQNIIELDFPIISGGIRLTDWINDQGIWRIRIPDSLPAVTQLFVDGHRAIRSRLPTNGYFNYEKGLDNSTQLAYQGFIYHEHQFDNITLSSISTSEFIIYHSYTTSRHYFSQNFSQNRTILFSNPSLSVIGNTSIIQESGQRFHLENIYEGMINQEGSFYFDSIEHLLYYHARKTENPQTTIVILPIAEKILSIVNVKKMEWNSIGFQHSAWIESNKTIPIDGRAAVDYLDQSIVAIYIHNSSEIKLDNIEISHIAGYAIQIDRKCEEINIVNSQMYDLGAGGIRIGIDEKIKYNNEQWIQNIIIENCTLYDSGHLFPMGVGILLQRETRNILIRENTLYQFFHTAIQIGWSWSYEESLCYNHTISFNYIHHIGQYLLSDLGGIYTCGILNDTLILNNVIHNIYGYFLHDWGIYLADGTSQVIISNTIVYNTGSAGLTMIYGFNNTFENNILARVSNESDGALSLYRRESIDHLSFTFRHNIIYDIVNESGRWIFQVQAPDPFSAPYVIMNYNCYFNLYGNMFIFGLGRLVFSEWQETNHDMNSLISDPLFVNAESQCNFFALNNNSPAIENLGFKPIMQLTQWKSGC